MPWVRCRTNNIVAGDLRRHGERVTSLRHGEHDGMISEACSRPICNLSYEISSRYYCTLIWCGYMSLQWRHIGHGSVSNRQPHDCLLNRLFRRRSKKTLKLHVTGLCAGNSTGTGEFPPQRASNAENVSIWWRHYVSGYYCIRVIFTHVIQGYFTGTGTIVWLPQCLWSNPELNRPVSNPNKSQPSRDRVQNLEVDYVYVKIAHYL